MSRIGHNSFKAGTEELPIPENVRPGPGWTKQMLEMAAHIGPYRTMQLVEAFGGMRIYIPKDPERGKAYEGIGSIVDVIGIGPAAKLSAVYTREYLSIPTARYALRRARRQAIIAEVRAGRLSKSEAARRLGTTRPYMSHLAKKEKGAASPIRPEGAAKSVQKDLFGDGDGA